MRGDNERQRDLDLWHDSSTVMIDIQRIRELRILIKTTEKELELIKKQDEDNTDAAAKELVVLEATRREVLKLELRIISAALA